MALAKTHKDLIVWRKAVSLASRVHELTAQCPGHDRQLLADQMRACAICIASSIAEGAATGSRLDYIRFLEIARGSLSELETQVQICMELQIVAPGCQLEQLVSEVGTLLSAMIRRLRENRDKARGFIDPQRPPTSH
jgi:four helix bundle protein